MHAYLEVPEGHTWFNHAQYVDTLSPEAMRSFIDVTHERYKERLGHRFGIDIPAIFTDEPLFRGMERPRNSDDDRDCIIAWTNTLPQTYQQSFHEDLVEDFPYVLFNATSGRERLARWRFHNHHTDRFSEAFAQQVGSWCENNNLKLTGHMMSEGTLSSQTEWVGEVMRSLQHFGLPGIDMFCNNFEFTTAKQAQSIARQTGAPGVMSELYGVTNWDFPFAGHLQQGNWQAALGIITRVHHLTWYQMGGEAKRDYPASMGEHVPWWPEYSTVEDHFARLNAALRSGQSRCRVGMLHPIESYWMVHGPDADALERERLEAGFEDTLKWMLEGLIDVDLISEATLVPEEAQGKGFQVGEMNYEVIVLPPLLKLRSSTLARLESFMERGGVVILLGSLPTHLDGRREDLAERLSRGISCSWQRESLLKALEPWRDQSVLLPNGAMASDLLYQARDLPGGERMLFLCNSSPERKVEESTLVLEGEWHGESLDTLSGASTPLAFQVNQGKSRLALSVPVAGHHLLKLTPGRVDRPSLKSPSKAEIGRLGKGSIPITLSEENVLLLDAASWRVNQKPWQPREDILRVDNLVRAELGMPPRSGDLAQPWIEPFVAGDQRVSLRFELQLDQPIDGARLAVEGLEKAEIILDGAKVEGDVGPCWVDSAFPTLALPLLQEGTHLLEVTVPFGGSEGLEPLYLVGDFSVHLEGVKARLGAPVTHLHWGDASIQGLAFYGGNITYHLDESLERGDRISIPHFSGVLLTLDHRGVRQGNILRAPWGFDLAQDCEGIDITCFGTRINTFGQLHNPNLERQWFSPGSWRTQGEHWTDECQIRKTGILSSPRHLR